MKLLIIQAVFRWLKVGTGPLMFRVDYRTWIFVDRYNQWWEIKETSDPSLPLIISCMRRG